MFAVLPMAEQPIIIVLVCNGLCLDDMFHSEHLSAAGGLNLPSNWEVPPSCYGACLSHSVPEFKACCCQHRDPCRFAEECCRRQQQYLDLSLAACRNWLRQAASCTTNHYMPLTDRMAVIA